MDMMQRCWEWMMSFGWIGMLLGIVLLVALIILVVSLIRRTWGPSRR